MMMQKRSSLELITELAVNSKLTLSELRERITKNVEKQYLKLQLIRHCGDQANAAKAAGISLCKFWELLEKNGIDPTHYTPEQKR